MSKVIHSILILSILILSLSCNKRPKEVEIINNDSKNRVNNWLKIDTLGNDEYKVSEYFGGFEFYNLTAIMFKRKLKDSPLESLAFGQWFFFGGDSGKLYSTGFYKEGIKDSIWINIFDDYSIPKLTFYKNGNIQSKYNGKVSIYDDKGKIWIEGNSFESNKIPKGEWKFYRYDIGKILVRKFKNEKDSIRVIQKKYELNTGNLIEINDFIEPNEENSWN